MYEFAPLEAITEDPFHRQFDTNVLGLILATQEAAKYFNGEGGSVINIGSTISSINSPQSAVYTATKHAVDGVTRVLSKEHAAKKIRVNSINPGLVMTEGTHTAGVIGSELAEVAVPSSASMECWRLARSKTGKPFAFRALTAEDAERLAVRMKVPARAVDTDNMLQPCIEGYSLTDRSNRSRLIVKAVVLCVMLVGSSCTYGQARATATEVSRLSVFLGGNGTWTRLNGGRTAGVTAGADLRFRSFFTLQPSIEVRGTLPLFKGRVDSQKNVLAGVQIARPFGRVKPYVDVLFGRGEIDYHGGFPDPTNSYTYFRTVSNVISPGIGADLDLTRHFGLKADAQYQRYDTPVTPTGRLGSVAFMGAIVYRFDFNHSPRNIQ